MYTVCAQPGCPNLTEQARCPDHQLPARPGRPMPTDWKRTRRRILIRDNYRCHYCGKKATSVDHRTPTNRGGTDHDTNLVACCWPCNQRKGSKAPRAKAP